ncbi:MAG: alpha/beta hydrolase family protein, partial [Thermoanaerobaculia bacterium]
FRAYLSAYEYDKTPLEAQLVSRDTSSADWIEEKIVMKAAYGGERVIVYVYLPRNARPPFQPVIFFPGSGAIHLDRFTGPGLTNDYLARSGRALVMPIFKGTYERRDAFKSDYPEHTTFYRDHVISWSKDIGRTIDYLETRQDMDVGKLSFVGLSWGGAMGPIMLAVEPRMKTAVLIVGGFGFQRAFQEVDQINFVPRVKQPTLMLNARYDHFFPVETSQVPMFRLLGTAERDKRRIVYESGHGLPRTEMIKETVAWLNRYAGPPRR